MALGTDGDGTTHQDFDACEGAGDGSVWSERVWVDVGTVTTHDTSHCSLQSAEEVSDYWEHVERDCGVTRGFCIADDWRAEEVTCEYVDGSWDYTPSQMIVDDACSVRDATQEDCAQSGSAHVWMADGPDFGTCCTGPGTKTCHDTRGALPHSPSEFDCEGVRGSLPPAGEGTTTCADQVGGCTAAECWYEILTGI